jgi:hypothetical protein
MVRRPRYSPAPKSALGALPGYMLPLPSPPPCWGMFPSVSVEWGACGAPAWPAILWAHPVSASMTNRAARHVCQFVTRSGPPDSVPIQCHRKARLCNRSASGPWGPSGIQPSPRSQLFDNFVGADKDRLRNSEAESLGGLEVDDEFECGRLLDR